MHPLPFPTVTAAFSLSVVNSPHPYWVSPHESRNMRDLVMAEITKAGITTGTGSLRYSTETRCRKKRNLKKNTVYLAPSSKLAQTTLILTVTGSNPSEDICDVLLTLSKDNCRIFKEHFAPSLPNPVLRHALENPTRPRSLDSATPTPSAAPAHVRSSGFSPSDSGDCPFDDDTLALFLDAVRDAGSTITKASAETIARKLTNATDIVTAALKAELIAPMSLAMVDVYSITIAGDALLRQKIDPPVPSNRGIPAPSDSPSELDRLKAAVREARAQHQAAKAKHDTRAQSLTTLTHQLTQAREALQSEQLHATTLQTRLQKLQQDLSSAQCKVTGAKRHVLDLEEQSRALGTDTPDLIQAERTLKAAEAAYTDLIAL